MQERNHVNYRLNLLATGLGVTLVSKLPNSYQCLVYGLMKSMLENLMSALVHLFYASIVHAHLLLWWDYK